jgi:uncharacterized membrane protein
MKKTKILYWIITGLFAAYMLFTAVPDALMLTDAVTFINGGLGYPKYFIPFIGVAKILGSIAILIPGLNRIKEWAYAGLFFDLVAAAYSIVYMYGLDASIIFMILPVIFLFLSYYLWHKLNTAS